MAVSRHIRASGGGAVCSWQHCIACDAEKLEFRVEEPRGGRDQTVRTRLDKADFLRFHDDINAAAINAAAQKATKR